MRNNRINFFESPNLSHFSINNLRQVDPQNPDVQEMHEERLFSTPVRLNTQLVSSPYPDIDPYFSHPHRLQMRRDSLEFDQQQPIQPQYEDSRSQSLHGIQERLEYSREESQQLLMPLTPYKNMMNAQENQEKQVQTTRRPANFYMTPENQSRGSQRGLKKLASQAFYFVTQQKKTTYKQVARRLIGQLSDDSDIDTSKKGMNIKRRVYDALNVLIALGLLRRNGNKILAKRTEPQEPICNNQLQRQRQRYREKHMEVQLSMLKTQYERRAGMLHYKRVLHNETKIKVDKMKQLEKKNVSALEKTTQQSFQKIDFPFLVLCQQERSELKTCVKYEKVVNPEMQVEQISENRVSMWQSQPSTFFSSCTSPKRLQLMGELDLIRHWKTEDPKKQMRYDRTKKKGR